MKKFYITNSIPYVNASPHIGHALEFVQSDVLKRFHKEILEEETLLLCGSDENALKNVQAAEKAGTPVQEFVDKNAKLFENLADKLNIQFDVFQKGSDVDHHFASSQSLWNLCSKKGDIYKKEYRGLYCVGCETFYTKAELNEDGECYEHLGKKLEEVAESNYFFKLSKYQDQLIELISSDKLSILPQSRKNEVLSFLKQPLQDISISRSNERAKNWGVPVPGDDSQRIYVWFDALNIYQSGIGFAWDEDKYKKWWPADAHVIGKGISRFHAVYWPAFLLSAGLETPKQILVHGYVTVEGGKMSKTTGNVVDPFSLIEKYGTDTIRYYLLREIPTSGDGDFSEHRFKELYNADLANGLGNLVARVTKLAESLELATTTPEKMSSEISEFINTFEFNRALQSIWFRIDEVNAQINIAEPWKITDSEKKKEFLFKTVTQLLQIAFDLQPFLPQTAKLVLKSVSGKITKPATLFPRL